MPEFVRVADRKSRARYSVVASAVREDAHEVLNEPATTPDGTPLPGEPAPPLPPPPAVPPKSLSSNKSDGHKAAPEKE